MKLIALYRCRDHFDNAIDDLVTQIVFIRDRIVAISRVRFGERTIWTRDDLLDQTCEAHACKKNRSEERVILITAWHTSTHGCSI